jgi:large subunit ribosomal protein L14e
MFEIGRLCVKIAGRDSGNYCVIIDVIDENTVLIDGYVRRRKCNIKHLEPLNKKLNLKKGASTSDIKKALLAEGIKIKERVVKRKPKKEAKSEKKPKAKK